MTTEAAGLGLAGVLAAHAWGGYVGPMTDRYILGRYARCGCGWTDDYDPDAMFDAWRAHVAEEVRTWLRAALTSPEVVEAAAGEFVRRSPGQTYINRTTAALAAAAETLGAK